MNKITNLPGSPLMALQLAGLSSFFNISSMLNLILATVNMQRTTIGSTQMSGLHFKSVHGNEN